MHLSSLNNLLIVLIFGSLLLLTFLKVANPLKVNQKANRWFALFLFIWASFWIEEIAALCGFSPLNETAEMSIKLIQFLSPLALFYSVVFFTNPDYQFGRHDLPTLLLPILFTMLLLFAPPAMAETLFYRLVIVVFILGQSAIYTIAGFICIQRHKKRILVFTSSTDEISLSWPNRLPFDTKWM